MESTTTSVVTKTQTLLLDNTEQTDTHPLDRSTIRIWSAIGARPTAAPKPSAAAQPPPQPGAVVSVMEYSRTRNVSTITRTLEDAGQTHPNTHTHTHTHTQRPSCTRAFFERFETPLVSRARAVALARANFRHPPFLENPPP